MRQNTMETLGAARGPAGDAMPLNLDAVTDRTLREVVVNPRTLHTLLPRTATRRDVRRKLVAYARHRLAARAARLSGNVQTALDRERTCERIYQSLPTWARW